MIEVKDLVFGYGKRRTVLNGVNFSAGRGEVVSILGPNGCGKSTLLKVLLGFFAAGRGMVCVDGVDVRAVRRRQMARIFSYVPQSHNGVFSYSALDVVLMGRTNGVGWHRYGKADHEAARRALETLRIAGFADRLYLHLSGGERQLVLIARALAQGAQYIVMDEPASGLDYGNQYVLLEAIQRLSCAGHSILLTTHCPEHARFLGGRALLMKEGRVIADGDADAVIHRASIGALYGMSAELLDRVLPPGD
ncbi:MAG: ABC transporter ATP-binding protein [Spirochaetaceae bacterium]|jgi:iron complex transport system ATP-binding protein|nr:ABC transporter ATP-binding protein [Spirochaetaceae bacterium]